MWQQVSIRPLKIQKMADMNVQISEYLQMLILVQSFVRHQVLVTENLKWKIKLNSGYQWQFKFKQGDNIKYEQGLERCRGRRRICRHFSNSGRLTEKVVLGTMCSEKCLISQTQVKELTIGAKQALVGDKKLRGLIGVCTLWLSRPRQHGAARQGTESYCNSDYIRNDQYFQE